MAFRLQASNTSLQKCSAGPPADHKSTPAHEGLADEWEAFLDDLQQTLDKFAVPHAEQAEIKAIIDSTRADIVV
jgi:hypothetical protein